MIAPLQPVDIKLIESEVRFLVCKRLSTVERRLLLLLLLFFLSFDLLSPSIIDRRTCRSDMTVFSNVCNKQFSVTNLARSAIM
ncbi:unnamed protein product [Schistosoma curassoni]|uniref:Uncharacterized protein n=1 Tax=Schistosoma curassoni TaxID=6186 RepID=A0A183K5C8_9TREM|nr:unnamed protein product [Schistosoma curassoni]